jgi:hypothetical protein
VALASTVGTTHRVVRLLPRQHGGGITVVAVPLLDDYTP